MNLTASEERILTDIMSWVNSKYNSVEMEIDEHGQLVMWVKGQR